MTAWTSKAAFGLAGTVGERVVGARHTTPGGPRAPSGTSRSCPSARPTGSIGEMAITAQVLNARSSFDSAWSPTRRTWRRSSRTCSPTPRSTRRLVATSTCRRTPKGTRAARTARGEAGGGDRLRPGTGPAPLEERRVRGARRQAGRSGRPDPVDRATGDSPGGERVSRLTARSR